MTINPDDRYFSDEEIQSLELMDLTEFEIGNTTYKGSTFSDRDKLETFKDSDIGKIQIAALEKQLGVDRLSDGAINDILKRAQKFQMEGLMGHDAGVGDTADPSNTDQDPIGTDSEIMSDIFTDEIERTLTGFVDFDDPKVVKALDGMNDYMEEVMQQTLSLLEGKYDFDIVKKVAEEYALELRNNVMGNAKRMPGRRLCTEDYNKAFIDLKDTVSHFTYENAKRLAGKIRNLDADQNTSNQKTSSVDDDFHIQSNFREVSAEVYGVEDGFNLARAEMSNGAPDFGATVEKSDTEIGVTQEYVS